MLSGTGANQRVDLEFPPAAGALTLTLSAGVTELRLKAGSSATSHIVTAGARVARSEDRAGLAGGDW